MFNVPSDSVWAAQQVARFPAPVKDLFLDAWQGIRKERLPRAKGKPNPARGVYSVQVHDDRNFRSNVWLRESAGAVDVSRLPRRVRLDDGEDFLYLDDDAIKGAAADYAALSSRLLRPGASCAVLAPVARKLGVQLPVVRGDAEPGQKGSEESAKARLKDPDWWKRAIGAAHGRAYESVGIDAGRVNAARCLYATDLTVEYKAARRRRNHALLSSMVATNEEGESFTLQDLVDRSVSNQAIRLAELMVRVRGFEEYAMSLGYVAEFYTLTAPSKYHAYDKQGERNPKYGGYTPRETQAYLNSVWRKVRSAWRHAGISTFGPRVVEPHHDGTPHWHLLLFVKPEQRVQLRKIFHRYALQEDGKERGAAKRRFTFKQIDPSKGSAVGYLAKYLAKNLDGFGTDGAPVDQFDFESTGNKTFQDTAFRVYAWASRWGIRQMQMIGTSSVTVWRELRRLDPATLSDGLRELAAAADAGDWAAYVTLLGGPTVSRDDLPICTARNTVTNRYGEEVKVIKGLTFRPTAEVVITRVHTWVIERQDPATQKRRGREASEASRPTKTPRTRVTNCAQAHREGAGGSEFPLPLSLHDNCGWLPPPHQEQAWLSASR